MTFPKPKLPWALLAVLVLGACGAEKSSPTAGSASEDGNGIDRAFAAQMAEHHEGAIDMAGLAADAAEHPEIEELAKEIVAGQQREIAVLERASTRLEEAGVPAGDLGIPEDMSGMAHDPDALKRADPFDRAFIDAMVPHHQGAIRMAHTQLEEGSDGELEALAEDVIESQSREIEQMNEWRTEWYGKPSPAGGVAAVAEGRPVEEEPHSGH